MLRLILLLAALFTAAALARPFSVPVTPDNPCGLPVPTPARTYYVDLAASGVPPAIGPPVACVPGPVGTGTVPTIRWNLAGVMGWYHCPQPSGVWVTTWGAETWASLGSHNLTGDAAIVAASSDPAQALNALLVGHITLPLADPSLTPVWCPFADEMNASKPPASAPPAPPPTGQWRTPAAGTGTIYTTAAGKLAGLVAGRKAPPNALCDCTAAKVAVGTSSYCALTGGPASEVTLCKAAP